MFFFESSKVVCEEGDILMYSNSECFVQKNDNDVVLTEHVVPLLYTNETDDFDVSIYLDETILQCLNIYKLVKVDGKKIYFDGKVVYTYEKSSEEFLETKFSEKCCILTIPKIESQLFGDNERLMLSFSKELFIKNTVGLHFKFQLCHLFEKCEVDVNSSYLIDIFKKNENSSCVVYCKKNSPLCFEFFEPKKRIFLAPLT